MSPGHIKTCMMRPYGVESLKYNVYPYLVFDLLIITNHLNGDSYHLNSNMNIVKMLRVPDISNCQNIRQFEKDSHLSQSTIVGTLSIYIIFIHWICGLREHGQFVLNVSRAALIDIMWCVIYAEALSVWHDQIHKSIIINFLI